MSILLDCQKTDLNSFSGPDLLTDEENIKGPRGISCQNIEYSGGGINQNGVVNSPIMPMTRRGFKQAWNPAVIIFTLYNWVQEQYQRVLFLDGTNDLVASRDLVAGTTTTIISPMSAAGMSCIQAGYRVIMAFFSTTGVGTANTQIWDGTFTDAVPNVDAAFPAAPASTLFSGFPTWAAFAEPSAGIVTAGLHYYSLVGTTWNGAQTPPGPVVISTNTFTPASFTSAGNKVIQITVTPATTWPLDLQSLQIAMTPTTNSDRWFLVGTIVPIPRGTNFTVVFTISIDDVSMLGGDATEITNTLFNQFVGPIEAHCLVSYNNRAVYIYRTLGPDTISTAGAILISDQYYPQSASLTSNLLTLPESRDTVTGFSVAATLFICGPSWTYAFSDNNNEPISWAPCRQVSGTVGSPFIRGVTSNPAKGRAWVADRTGLYAFTGGVFFDRPASYYQSPDWSRINFGAPQSSFRVVEYDSYRMVAVKAALDGATVANYIMVWDYTNGTDPEDIRYCGLWPIANFPGIGDVEIVQNVATLSKELWVSRGDSAGNVKRQMSIEAGDVTPANPDKPTNAELSPLYNDDGVGIVSKYKAILVTGSGEGVRDHVAVSVRERGNGQINLTAYSFDQNVSVNCSPITSAQNSMSPGQRFVSKFNLQSEDLSIQLDNGGTVGAFFWLAAIRAYWTWWFRER